MTSDTNEGLFQIKYTFHNVGVVDGNRVVMDYVATDADNTVLVNGSGENNSVHNRYT